MFPSFSVTGQLHARARQIMFLLQFQCSNNFGSVRSALHQRVIARTIQCNWSTLVQTWIAWMGYFRPFELWGARGTYSLLQLFPFLWLLFQFWVHLPGIFFNVCRPARQSECWINYWMDTKTAACGQVGTWLCLHPYRNESASRQALHAFFWVVQTQGILRWCDQPSSKTPLWQYWQLLLTAISRYNHTNSTMPHKMFICFGHGDGRQLNRCFAVVANAVAWGVACQGERKQRRSIT